MKRIRLSIGYVSNKNVKNVLEVMMLQVAGVLEESSKGSVCRQFYFSLFVNYSIKREKPGFFL